MLYFSLRCFFFSYIYCRNDVRNDIKNTIDKVPFRLVNKEQPRYPVTVSEPLSAYYVKNELKVIYDNYEETKSGIVAKTIDRAFGEITKGYQEKEKMLTVGTYLLGIGRITVEDGNVILEPPMKGERYILTRMSKKELLKDMSGGTKTLKVMYWLFTSVAVGLFVYFVYKKFKTWRERVEEERIMNELRLQRVRSRDSMSDVTMHSEASGASGDDQGIDLCSVCLSNPRNVVLLNCGHICVCVECYAALPSPKKCPMCREHVQRVLPVYRP